MRFGVAAKLLAKTPMGFGEAGKLLGETANASGVRGIASAQPRTSFTSVFGATRL